MKQVIKFGIYINRNINNLCHLYAFNIFDHYKKIDIYNYIAEMGDSYEDFDQEIQCFQRDAKVILENDRSGQKTEFYFVAYIEDDKGNIEDMKKIKQLYY